MLQIKSLEKLSLIDFPGHVASIIFLGGCNFRCDYCYNKDLVYRHEQMPNLSEDEVFATIAERKSFLDGVVITGGEATLQTADLKKFISRLRSLGLRIKLDTNGYRPEKIVELVPLVDYIAMDVKAPPERYSEIVGRDIATERIIESINLLKESSIDYEFRTTVWKDGFSIDDFYSIFELIKGAKNYYIQNMYPVFTIKPKKVYESMARIDIEPIMDIGAQYVKNIALRGKWE